jgi:integrase/recombinase XerD
MTEWVKALERLEGAYSDHSLRAYRSDFQIFEAWCQAHDQPALPASSQTIAAFVNEQQDRVKPATLKRRLCGIRKVHRLTGHPDPTDNEGVYLAIRRARRAKPARPQQALGVTAGIRDKLLAACSDDLIGLRDRVMVSVGFDTLCRGGELVSLAVGDLTRKQDGRFEVLVRRAKNDPEGAGRTCKLSAASSRLLDEWLRATGITSGPLLRPVYHGHCLSRYLSRITVTRVLKRLTNRAGLAPIPSVRYPATP